MAKSKKLTAAALNTEGRYWVFIWPCYYPHGGMNDFRFSDNRLSDAVEFSKIWFDGKGHDRYLRTAESVFKECYGEIYDSKLKKVIMWKNREADFSRKFHNYD